MEPTAAPQPLPSVIFERRDPRAAWIVPVLAGVLAVLLPGAGFLVLRRWARAVVWLVLGVAGYVALVVPGVVVHLLGVVFTGFTLWSDGRRRPCPACRSSVSKDATACPRCREPLQPIQGPRASLVLYVVAVVVAGVVVGGVVAFEMARGRSAAGDRYRDGLAHAEVRR